MIAVVIEGATRRLGPPQGVSKEDCHDLSIRDVPHDVFGNQQWSAWEPTPKEAALLAAGAKVYLSITGTVFPPVMMAVGHFFEKAPDGFKEPKFDAALELLQKPDVREAREVADSASTDFEGAPAEMKAAAEAMAKIIDAQADVIEAQHSFAKEILGGLEK